MVVKKKEKTGPILIKKYANRRLYNTESSQSVTLDGLAEMVRQDKDFKVVDAKTGEDLTRPVLVQIIFEQEARGPYMMPVQFLRRLISFYGNNMQKFLPAYLDMSLETFMRHQEEARDKLTGFMSGSSAFKLFEDQARKNAAFFESFFSNPQSEKPRGEEKTGNSTYSERSSDTSVSQQDEHAVLKSMQEHMKALQKQMDKLSGKKS